MSARTISTSCATSTSATPPWRWRRSRATRSIGAPRTAPRTGPRPTIFRRWTTGASSWRNSRDRSSGVMQAFALNLRRDKFRDPRVRRAFNFAFDFEEMNKQIFYGQYKRINSYFDGTELASSGLPRRQGAGDPRNRARRGAGRGLHHALYQSGQRQSRGGARQPARSATLAEGSRIGDAERKLVDTRPARRSRSSSSAPTPASSASCCSTSRRWSVWASALPCAPSIPRNTKTGCATATST